MKCSNCGTMVGEKDKFCGECGKPIITEITPKWKWGSMIASLVLIFIFWVVRWTGPSLHEEGLFTALLLLGFPATIYLMYKERKAKIKYGLVWILFPILILLTGLSGLSSGNDDMWFILFFIFIIPAIVIDLLALRKML